MCVTVILFLAIVTVSRANTVCDMLHAPALGVKYTPGFKSCTISYSAAFPPNSYGIPVTASAMLLPCSTSPTLTLNVSATVDGNKLTMEKAVSIGPPAHVTVPGATIRGLGVTVRLYGVVALSGSWNDLSIQLGLDVCESPTNCCDAIEVCKMANPDLPLYIVNVDTIDFATSPGCSATVSPSSAPSFTPSRHPTPAPTDSPSTTPTAPPTTNSPTGSAAPTTNSPTGSTRVPASVTLNGFSGPKFTSADTQAFKAAVAEACSSAKIPADAVVVVNVTVTSSRRRRRLQLGAGTKAAVVAFDVMAAAGDEANVLSGLKAACADEGKQFLSYLRSSGCCFQSVTGAAMTPTPPPSPGTTQPNNNKKGGPTVGVAVGVSAGILAIAGGALYAYRRRRKRKSRRLLEDAAGDRTPLMGSAGAARSDRDEDEE